jgi:hypothetical protein
MSRAKYNREMINQTLTLFTRAAEKEYGTHAYAAGALTTLLTNAMVDMPLHKQKEIMVVLSELVTKHTEL